MATLIAGQGATPGQPGTRPAAGGDDGFPGRRSRRPEHARSTGRQAASRTERGATGTPSGRVPVRPENRT